MGGSSQRDGPERGDLAGSAGRTAGAAQVGAACASGQASAVRRLRHGSGGRSRAHLHVTGADLRARGPRRGLVAGGARAPCRRRAQGRHRAQYLRLSSDAGRLDPGLRRPRARLRRDRRGPRQHRAAARGHPGAEAHRLRGRARLPQDPARQGARDGQGRHLLQEGDGGRRRTVPLAESRIQAARGRHVPDLRHGRPRHRRLRKRGAGGHDRRRGRDRGDRAAGHRRSGAGRARWARWSSPPSTATIR